jgi:hypothetical protein
MPTIPSLLGSYIDETYQRLVQVSGSSFADGLGNPITIAPGSVNPTPTYLPFNNAGTFADSYLNQSGGILKTTSASVDLGLKLDFAANSFTLGDPAGNIITVSDNGGGDNATLSLLNGNVTFTADDEININAIGAVVLNAPNTSIKQLTSTSQLNVLTIDTASGQLYYTASSAIGGGGSGTPGGSNTQIQFNSNGAFSGSSALTFNSGSNTLTLTGSLNITGSQTITGLLTVTQNISASSFTGSLFGTATTASYVTASAIVGTVLSASYAQTSSYVVTAQTASYVTASAIVGTVLSASYAQTSSYVVTALTASYVTASAIVGTVLSASYAQTASYVVTALTASYVTGSIFTNSNSAASASYALTSSFANDFDELDYLLVSSFRTLYNY